MNIVVKSYIGECFVRPDTTWERDAEDFYPPEFVSGLSWTPVLFAHVSKPGRSISEKFALRYFDGLGFGALLYPTDMLDGAPSSIARASCLDHTSFLTFPTEGLSIDSYSIEKNGIQIFAPRVRAASNGDGSDGHDVGTARCDIDDMVKAIAETSKYVYLRYGDIVAIELDDIKPLCKRDEREVAIQMSFNGNPCGNFRIIF